MLTGLCIGALLVLTIWRISTRRNNGVSTPHIYTTHVLPKEDRLLQAMQNGQNLTSFAQVELQDGVVVITAERITTLRIWQEVVILNQSGVRGGVGRELQIPLYGIIQGLCLLNEIQEV